MHYRLPVVTTSEEYAEGMRRFRALQTIKHRAPQKPSGGEQQVLALGHTRIGKLSVFAVSKPLPRVGSAGCRRAAPGVLRPSPWRTDGLVIEESPQCAMGLMERALGSGRILDEVLANASADAAASLERTYLQREGNE